MFLLDFLGNKYCFSLISKGNNSVLLRQTASNYPMKHCTRQVMKVKVYFVNKLIKGKQFVNVSHNLYFYTSLIL